MFKDWYLTRSPIVETGPVSSASQQPKAPDPSASTTINIQVSPTIAGASIHHGFTPEEVNKLLNIINQLKNEISNLPIDEQTKMEAQHALDEGIKKPDKNTMKSSLEKTTGILKSAGGVADSLTSFIKIAEKLGPYLGQSIGWLSTLF
jgi:hypothetical protein